MSLVRFFHPWAAPPRKRFLVLIVIVIVIVMVGEAAAFCLQVLHFDPILLDCLAVQEVREAKEHGLQYAARCPQTKFVTIYLHIFDISFVESSRDKDGWMDGSRKIRRWRRTQRQADLD